MIDLVQHYETCLPAWLHDDGFSRPPLLALHHDGTITMACMAIPQETIFRAVMNKFIADVTIKEVIFGVDRYTKPGQGTKYDDVLTVFWWQGKWAENSGFRFGVVNYRPPPNQVIEPIDWNNSFWNDIMFKIVDEFNRDMMGKLETIAKTGGQDIIDKVTQLARDAQQRAMRGRKS